VAALPPSVPERRSTPPTVPPAVGHPRPLLRRPDWWSLDGPWDFETDVAGAWEHPDDVDWSGRTITVPFAPETPASGIGVTGYLPACWYRRTFTPPPARRRERVVLHFGAVDHECSVWVDGQLAVRHEGGYSPFSADITRAVRDGGVHTIVVRAVDDPLDLAKPRGKQDWELEPHSIWYPRTTGIWQSVWLERLPAAWIASVQWSADLDETSSPPSCASRARWTPGAACGCASAPGTGSSWTTGSPSSAAA
jgi:beta-galactosidase/beta-glucuronidase